jgi:hypothetical protein
MRTAADTEDKRSRGVGGHYLPTGVQPPPLWQYHNGTLTGERLSELRRLVAPVVAGVEKQPALGYHESKKSSSISMMANTERKHPWIDGIDLPSPLLQLIYRGTFPRINHIAFPFARSPPLELQLSLRVSFWYDRDLPSCQIESS